MRIFATLLSVVLLSIPGASLFSQDMMMDGTGFYAAAGGGATLITDTTDTPQSESVGGAVTPRRPTGISTSASAPAGPRATTSATSAPRRSSPSSPRTSCMTVRLTTTRKPTTT